MILPQIHMSTMCGRCGDMTMLNRTGTGFVAHLNRRTGQPCPGDHDYPAEPERGKTLRAFYDTKFIEDGRTIQLLSIGVVCENGREFYRVINNMPPPAFGVMWSDAANHTWLRENVLPSMPGRATPHSTIADWYTWAWDPKHPDFEQIRTTREAAAELYQFLLDGITPENNTDIELWADYGAYDHVALCQMWGPMSELPPGMPMWTHDFQQELTKWSTPWRAGMPEQPKGQRHNALADARHLALQYKWLQDELSHPF